MTPPLRNGLTMIGFWSGPDTSGAWPSAVDFVDEGWDADVRSFIADYLRGGHVAWAFMGWSRCRMCGQNNGDLELTDGTYLWPSGLVHYVEDHGVRLPPPFVAHAQARMEDIEQAEQDGDWWRAARPEARTTTAAEAPRLSTGADLEDVSRCPTGSSSYSATEPELVLPDDFDAYGWEVEAKGCLLDVTVRWSGQDFLVSFYDPVRLAQDVAADLERSSQTTFDRLLVVHRLTREVMQDAARALPPSFFDASGT